MRRIGYRAEGWTLGINRGNVGQLTPRVVARLEQLATPQQPIKLVGWSLGGVLAREAARQRPSLVDHVVTLGTPVIGGPKYTAVAAHYRQQGIDLDEIERQVAEANREPLPMAITAIYSRLDGVVATRSKRWRA